MESIKGRCIVVYLLMLGGAGLAGGSTIVVDSATATVAPDLRCSLVEAIENANVDAEVHPDCAAGSGADTIELAASAVYTLDRPDNFDLGPTGLPVIIGDLVIHGNRSVIERSPSAAPFRILAVAPGASLTMHALELRNGRLEAPLRGAGVLNLRGKLVADSCRISSNVAEYRCGGIANLSGSTTLVDSTVRDNSAGREGGGVCNLVTVGDATVILVRSALERNTAARDGGGLLNAGSERFGAWAYLTQATISDNHAGRVGGGVVQRVDGAATALRSSIAVVDSTVQRNSADGVGGGGIAAFGAASGSGTSRVEVRNSRIVDNEGALGGGAEAWGGVEMSVTASTIADNRAPLGSGGGLVVAAGSRLDLRRSTVSGNRSGPSLSSTSGSGDEPGSFGGGMVVLDSEATVWLSTLSGNAVLGGDGGAVWVGSSRDGGGGETSAVITASTIVDNRAGGSGGGVAVGQAADEAPVRVSVRGTIFAGNVDDIGLRSCASTHQLSIVSLGDNLGDDDSCGLRTAGDLIVGDVMLSPLGDNGGPTLTHLPEPGSPAIDSVSGRPVGACVDQRGFQRVVDGYGDGDCRCDRGAVEARSAPMTTAHGRNDVPGGSVGSAGG